MYLYIMYLLKTMTRKIELFLLFAILINNVTGDPEEPFCCKPGQGVLEDVSNVCVDVEHNVTSKTKLSCKKVDLLPISFLNFTVMDDGSLLMFIDGMEPPPVDKENFCVANETTNSTETVLVLCADEEVKIIDDNVLAYCMLVSVVFLSLTVFVYCILPEMRDVQGKSLINFCISLAIGLCILSFMRILEFSDMGLCAARGFFVYFFLLTSFFWTNAISIQILINIRRSSVADYGWNTFIWYAVYAWGVPAVLTVCMAIVNFHPGRHPKPGIGLNTCWFYSKKQQWQYMYSVMTILILANICIFVHISLQVCKQSFSSNHIKALRYKLFMTIKMFIVMGLPWIFEMISSLFQPHIIWVAIDIFNTLQGPLIFLILVVLRRKVIKALYKRGWLDCMAGLIERHLAVGDDEEDIVHQTTDVALDDKIVN